MTRDRTTRSRRRAGRRASLVLAAAALLATAAGPAAADLLSDGAAAYRAGDYGEAARVWRPLAEEGDAKAQFNLGLLRESGHGVPQDPAGAAAWYERAALQGVTAAQYNLALLHQTGRGLPQNAAEALYWLEVAARLGEGTERDRAADAAGRLAKTLPLDEAEAARARARVFSPRPEARPVVGTAETTLALSQRQIATLQRRLAAHGYDPGPADGIPGERTRSAVRLYLADRGLAWSEGEHLTQRLLDLVQEP